jgi:hypothetical protein
MTTAERRTDDRDGYPPPALTAAVLGLIAVVLAVWAVAAIGQTLDRALTAYTPVEVTVVDERTEERLVADRRGSRLEPFRVVTVELPDRSSADVRSDDLAIGDTATVSRSDAGLLFETAPPRPGPLEWSLCAALVTATVVLAFAAARSALRLRRSRPE